MSELNLVDIKLTLKFSDQNYYNSSINLLASDQNIYNFATMLRKYQAAAPSEIIKTSIFEYVTE